MSADTTNGVVSVRGPADLKRRLDALKESTGRPAAFYLRQALSARIDDMEWAYGVAARAEAIRTGVTDTLPFDEALADLGVLLRCRHGSILGSSPPPTPGRSTGTEPEVILLELDSKNRTDAVLRALQDGFLR